MSHNSDYRPSTITNPFSLGNGNDQVVVFEGSVPLPRVNNSPSDPQSKMISFVFSYDEDILNSVVLGPKGRQYFVVATDARKHLITATTIIQSTQGTHARVDWHHSNPTVEWIGLLNKQRTGSFLRLTQDRKRRLMTFGETQLAWWPSHTSVLLSTEFSEVIARVITSPTNSTILEITEESLAQGMLEIVVLAVVLFMSGRPID
ncbi:hypothetical protein DL96DRAFT_1683457 [Flagelloscypha sp. PMI_526]|nr:hypothetical protein DL96DRAFT_1683457 [Flagelloscypha sp. PMI_526]